MSRFLLIIAAFCAAGLLAACATLSKAECEAGDWRSVGIADGVNGRPASYISNHVSACSEYGITLDNRLYETGRQEGLRTYCRLERAEREGREGNRNYNSCQGEIGVSFNLVYAAAKAVHDVEVKLSNIDGDISSAVAELARPDIDDARRAALRSEIQSLQSSRRSLERELSTRERELASIRRTEEARLRQAGIAY